MKNTKWVFDEFLAFLLIYASHVDFDFSDEEKDEIEKIVGKDIFDEIYAHFITLTDYQALEVILSYRGIYFSTVEEKELLFKEIHNLFNVDGDFSTLEKELLLFLKKLM